MLLTFKLVTAVAGLVLPIASARHPHGPVGALGLANSLGTS